MVDSRSRKRVLQLHSQYNHRSNDIDITPGARLRFRNAMFMPPNERELGEQESVQPRRQYTSNILFPSVHFGPMRVSLLLGMGTMVLGRIP